MDELVIPIRKIKSILRNPEKTAAAVNLIYVNNAMPGIKRLKKGKSFSYIMENNSKVKDKKTIERIQKLVIPPAWENVWICIMENGHLQATGIDVKKRKQYKYHSLWNSLRNHTKYYRLHEFGKVMPDIRMKLDHDLSLPGMPLDKVLATVVSLIERTSIRIGNNMYEKLYGSFGLTTLKDKHVKINGNNIQFLFKGKKGISHDISIRSKRLAAIVKKCRDIPGQELFQFIDEHGKRHTIDSGMVNNYIRTISGNSDFTAKDFRTWSGSVRALVAFKEMEQSEKITQIKKNIVAVLDMVAEHLGNTRTVCKKYYVHPLIFSLYENKNLHKYLSELEEEEARGCGLTGEERLLLKILENESVAISINA